MQIPQSLIDLVESGAHAHLVTINKDGTPHVTVVWIGIENDEIAPAWADHPTAAAARPRCAECTG